MIKPLTSDELKEMSDASQHALGLLDLNLHEGGDVNTGQIFDSLLRCLSKHKNLPARKRENELINLLGILFGQLIVWEAGWVWTMYYPTADSAQLCVTDKEEKFAALPMDQVWEYIRGSVDTLELEYRMIISGKLPEPTEDIIFLTP